ncbi:MAG TPA: hypothetical protein VGI81_22720 [Tepidisphaeraceae bacterium]|jgi:hypothetical protein
MPVLYAANQNYPLYLKREAAPNGFKALKTSNFTFHHIMPYCYAATIGHVVDTVIRAGIPNAEDATSRKIVDQIEDICSRVLSRDYPHVNLSHVNPGDPRQSFVHKFAWMGANLFMGPEGMWRLDDPGHGPEQNRPCSFHKACWDGLQNIITLLERSFKFIDTAGQGYSVVPKMDLSSDGPGSFLSSGQGLLALLKTILHGNSGTPHDFQMDDWLVVDSEDKAWKRTIVTLSDDEVSAGRAKTQLRGLVAANNVILYRPVAIKGIEREYPNMVKDARTRQNQYRDDKALNRDPNSDLGLGAVQYLFSDASKNPTSAVDDWRAFWRLRQEAESLADLPKIKANFRIGGSVTPDRYT